jgi:hypothetical protein
LNFLKLFSIFQEKHQGLFQKVLDVFVCDVWICKKEGKPETGMPSFSLYL